MQRHTISLTKCAHLSLEIPLRVVRLLFVDIPHQRTEVRRANGKQTIPTLPGEMHDPVLLDPYRRGRLQFGNGLCRSSGRSQSQRKMYMIRNAACTETFAVEFASGSGKIGMQGRCDVVGDQRRAIFGTEDNMNEVKAQRLWHEWMRRAFSPLSFVRHPIPGLRPRLLCAGPSALLRCTTPVPGLRSRLLCGRAFGPEERQS